MSDIYGTSFFGIERTTGEPLQCASDPAYDSNDRLLELIQKVIDHDGIPSPSCIAIWPSQVRLFEKYYESLGHRSPMYWRQSVEARIRLRKGLSRALKEK